MRRVLRLRNRVDQPRDRLGRADRADAADVNADQRHLAGQGDRRAAAPGPARPAARRRTSHQGQVVVGRRLRRGRAGPRGSASGRRAESAGGPRRCRGGRRARGRRAARSRTTFSERSAEGLPVLQRELDRPGPDVGRVSPEALNGGSIGCRSQSRSTCSAQRPWRRSCSVCALWRPVVRERRSCLGASIPGSPIAPGEAAWPCGRTTRWARSGASTSSVSLIVLEVHRRRLRAPVADLENPPVGPVRPVRRRCRGTAARRTSRSGKRCRRGRT